MRDRLLRILPDDERASFRKCVEAFERLADARNVAAHFGVSSERGGEEIVSLAAVQLKAWHSLRVFSESWPSALAANVDWQVAETALGNLREFIQAKAEALKPYLREIQAEGGAVGFCVECGYCGLCLERRYGVQSGVFYAALCKICLSTRHAARGSCTDCRKPLLAPLVARSGAFEVQCVAGCACETELEEFGGVRIADWPSDRKNSVGDPGPPLCGYCACGELTLLLGDDEAHWLYCPICDVTWEDGLRDVETCECCGVTWVGAELKDSGVNGCPACPGINV